MFSMQKQDRQSQLISKFSVDWSPSVSNMFLMFSFKKNFGRDGEWRMSSFSSVYNCFIAYLSHLSWLKKNEIA